jgi:regulator of replication initiation timing
MDIKILLIGLVAGLLVGAGLGYAMVSPQVGNLQAQVNTLQTSVTSIPGLQTQITQLTSDKTTLQGQISTLQGQLNSKTNEVTTLNNQVTTLQSQVTTLTAQVAELKKQIPSPPPAPGEPGTSRFSPISIGSSLTCRYIRGGDQSKVYTAIITVTQVIRGSQAWSQILAANQFNDPAPSGTEYILLKVKYNYVTGPTVDSLENLSEFTFKFFSGTGTKYDIPAIVEPDPSFDGSIYPGNTLEGWLTIRVSTTDLKPMLSFAVATDGTGGNWFKLY